MNNISFICMLGCVCVCVFVCIYIYKSLSGQFSPWNGWESFKGRAVVYLPWDCWHHWLVDSAGFRQYLDWLRWRRGNSISSFHFLSLFKRKMISLLFLLKLIFSTVIWCCASIFTTAWGLCALLSLSNFCCCHPHSCRNRQVRTKKPFLS